MTEARIGVVGLGTMGAALAMNIADNGFTAAVYNRRPEVTTEFMEHAGALADRLIPTDSYEALAANLTKPRAILMMVTAGPAVDSVIDSVLPFLEPGDLLIDGGNADFHDTRRREADLRAKGFNFIGMGVSGGEEGARHGPSIMVGGPAASYAPIQDIIEAISAKYQGAPCAAHLGPDGAGHFVKTVHNGIEYGDMQLIAEVYGLLRDGEKRSPATIGQLFETWGAGVLHSYLVEITGKVLQTTDPETGAPIVDMILDRAGQKGTGRWTLIEALRMGQSPSTIEAAVAARSWSSAKEVRERGEALYPKGELRAHPVLDSDLEEALLAARIIAYAQGLSLLQAASEEFKWDLDLAQIAEIWRAGCIIRSALLDPIAKAVRDGLHDGQLIFAPAFVDRIAPGIPALRRIITAAIQGGLPVPAMSAALSYFDTMTTARGTTDLIQGQRDFFGAHGFERIDGGSGHHGPWHS